MFVFQNRFRYTDKLNDLVRKYDNTIHSAFKMEPIDAIKQHNYNLLINNHYNSFENKSNKVKFGIGDVISIPITCITKYCLS